MSDAWLVVGLRDPGTRYVRNRHNVDYTMFDVPAECTGFRLPRHKKTRTRAAEGRLDMMSGETPGPRVILAEPPIFMNLSGDPVAGLVSYCGVDPANRLLVIHDELNLPAYELRLKRGGGEGGHSGLCFISKSVSTKDYARLHVGISCLPGHQSFSDSVLSDLPGRRHADLGITLGQTADAVERVVTVDLDDAQQYLHAPR